MLSLRLNSNIDVDNNNIFFLVLTYDGLQCHLFRKNQKNSKFFEFFYIGTMEIVFNLYFMLDNDENYYFDNVNVCFCYNTEDFYEWNKEEGIKM